MPNLGFQDLPKNLWCCFILFLLWACRFHHTLFQK